MLEEAIKHEFFQLDIAFKQFLTLIPENRKTDDPVTKVALYSVYSKVIQHLWELMKAQVAYEMSKTQSEREDVVEAYVVEKLEECAAAYGDEMRYPSLLEAQREKYKIFAKDLRVHRNKVSGHVLKQRFSGYPLADFYRSHQAWVTRLVLESEKIWRSDISELSSLEEVKEFSLLLTFGQASWR